MLDKQRITGLFSQARRRKDNNSLEGGKSSLLKIDASKSTVTSPHSLSSDQSSTMRECPLAARVLSSQATQSESIELMSTIERATSSLFIVLDDINKAFADNPLLDSLNVNSVINALLKPGPNASSGDHIKNIGDAIEQLGEALCGSSQYYQVEHQLEPVQRKVLTLFDRLIDIAKIFKNSCPQVLAVEKSGLNAHSAVLQNKAWLQYQRGDSGCLASLNNAKNMLDRMSVENTETVYLAVKHDTLSTVNTWLAIFQLDEKFGTCDQEVRTVRINESINLLKESLVSTDIAKVCQTFDGIRERNQTCIEIRKADVMLKINALLSLSNNNLNSFTLDSIYAELSSIYDRETGENSKELGDKDVFALAYVLGCLHSQQSKQDIQGYSNSLSKSSQALKKWQSYAINDYEISMHRLADFGLQGFFQEVVQYAKSLFESQNNGGEHSMNLVACSHDWSRQTHVLSPKPDKDTPMAMF